MKIVKATLIPKDVNVLDSTYHVFKFRIHLDIDMNDDTYDNLNANLSAATDDYVGLEYEFGGFGLLRGVYAAGYSCEIHHVFAAFDVLYEYGYLVEYDEQALEDFFPQPDDDLPFVDEQ